MSNDLAVWFYHRHQNPLQERWVWHRAQQAPVVGDFVVTPAGSQWVVVGRTWVEGTRCNVVVKDMPTGVEVIAK